MSYGNQATALYFDVSTWTGHLGIWAAVVKLKVKHVM